MLSAKALIVCCFTIFAELSLIEAFENNHYINDLLEERKHYEAAQKSIAEWKHTLTRNRKKRADKVVCYGELGCFEETAYLEMLPSPPEEINTKFFVYSAKHRSEKPILEFYYDEIAKISNGTTPPPTPTPKTANTTAPIKHRYAPDKVYEKFGNLENATARAIIHGFGSACTHVWVYEMRTALMAVEDCIVICMDWENGATLPNYVRAAANTRLVGRQLAFLLQRLETHNKLNMSRVHLIGFSLGSHAAGFAGAELKGLNRITGLDPAGPLFESQHPHARLDDSDAGFVDVIHSNGENLILGGLGSWQPMGAVDFYPNGGRVQHGCSNLFVGAVTDIIWAPPSIEGRSLCNHRRAYKFFIDSVAPKCLFPAFPCDNYENFLKGDCFSCKRIENGTETSVCGNMGYYADRSVGRGQLYLKTREEEPFCAHQYKLQIHSSPNELPLRTLGRLEVELESDGGLTEVFTITEKDDSEIFAGEMISQILVPHPALGFPKNITLTYLAYKGWLTRGLASWSISKIILSDGFGKSFSLCKQMHLDSNNPIHLTLLPGECESEDDYVHSTTNDNHSTDSPADTGEADIEDNSKAQSNERNDVDPPPHPSHLPHDFRGKGTHDKEKNIDTQPWQPIVIDLPRSYRNIDVNTSYPIYVTPTALTSVSTTLPPNNSQSNISEPVLKRGQQEPRKLQNKTKDRSSDKRSIETPSSKDTTDLPSESKLITVQLFPYRFANVFEKAERYARLTLLPLLTEQFTQFFKPKPEDEELSDLENIEFNQTEPVPTIYKSNKTERSMALSRRVDYGYSSASNPLGEHRNFKEDRTESVSPSTRKAYISEDVLFQMHRIEQTSESVNTPDTSTGSESPIRIDLPTFRPPKSKMIPLVEQPQTRFIPLNYNGNTMVATRSKSNVMGDTKPNDSNS
ncbi:uncharacterized protein LOC128738017 [Sabethes cyaneus]|uniref:uncharacterized protein LOC128738017 n=1 Tax=Sabethes cyaneus TaxID=53552 RepID=UPI00237E13C8|nr:uncharacterized protein LOC128738017 [Sabethes cyaneus]